MSFFQIMLGLAAFAVAMGVFILLAVSWACNLLDETKDPKR